ncbi:MAG: PilX N-terminal domain-containing pilus assembly protein [Desulfuromonadales bacterium]
MKLNTRGELWPVTYIAPCTPGLNERGIALITVILLIMVLSFVSAVTIVTSITELKIGGNFKTAVQSFYNAEAGVQYTLGQIKNKYAAGTLNISGNPYVLHYSAPNTAVYPLLANGQLPFSTWTTAHLYLQAGTTNSYLFQATGYYSNVNTRLQAVVRMPSFTMVRGVFMSNALNVNNNINIVGPPYAEFGSNVSLTYGNTDFVSVILGGSATYSGSATVTHVSTITADPLGAVALVSAHNYSASNNNATAGIAGNTISGNKTLSPGNYYLTSISSGNLTINGSGAVNIYINGGATAQSLSSITINAGSGPVTIYYHGSGGSTFNMANATLNSGGSASNLTFICDTASTLDFQSGPGGTYSGLFYAPYAGFLFKNNDYFNGILWGNSMTAQNNFKFRYDATAATYFGSTSSPSLVAWRQL